MPADIARLGGRAVVIRALALAVSVVVGGCASDGAEAPNSLHPLEFRTLYALSGDEVTLQVSDSVRSAVRFAVAEINSDAGVLGRPAVLGENIDAAPDDVSHRAAITQFLESAPDFTGAVIGPDTSAEATLVVPVVTERDIVICSPTAGASGVPGSARSNSFFRTTESAPQFANSLVQLLIADRATSVRIVAEDGLFATDLVDTLVASATRHGITVAGTVGYSADDYDAAALAQQVTAISADATVLVPWSQDAADVLVALRALDGRTPIVAAVLRQPIEALAASNPEAVEGVRAIDNPVSHDSEFADQLLRVSPSAKSGENLSFAGFAYDCVNVIALAAEAARSTDTRLLGQSLRDVTNGDEPCRSYASCRDLLDSGQTIAYIGASGPLYLSPDGQRSRTTLAVYEYRDGRPVEIARYDTVAE